MVLVHSSGRSRITREKELHFAGAKKREDSEDGSTSSRERAAALDPKDHRKFQADGVTSLRWKKKNKKGFL